jgi:hypothetical protein
VVLNQLQEWSSQIFRKESKKFFLQAQYYYLCCYLKCYGEFLVCQAGCSIVKPEIIKILLKSLDTSQLRQKTSTIARLDFWKNTSKVVAKHTCGVGSTCYFYGKFLQGWNTLGELC